MERKIYRMGRLGKQKRQLPFQKMSSRKLAARTSQGHEQMMKIGYIKNGVIGFKRGRILIISVLYRIWRF